MPRLALTLIAALILLSGITCGTAPPVSDVNDEQRLADIEQAQNIVDAAMADDGAVDIARVVNELSAMPGVSLAEEYDGGAYAKFADGEVLVVYNNRDLGELSDDVSDAPTARAKPTWEASARVPNPKKARLLNGMGNWYTNVIPQIKPWIENSGYQISQLEASLPNLIGLNGDGIFYLSTHGMRVRLGTISGLQITPDPDPGVDTPAPTTSIAIDGLDHFALWTTTPLTNEIINQYRPDFRAGRLVYAVGKWNRGPNNRPTLERHVAITENFIRDSRMGWHFKSTNSSPNPHSIVYIDACSSADNLASAACQMQGADYYLGWSAPTNDGDSALTTKFLFDRLTGANSVGPIRNPPQRPFNLDAVMGAMRTVRRRNGQPIDTSIDFDFWGQPIAASAAQLKQLKVRGSPGGQIRPGIEAVAVDEINDRLILSGDFGDMPGKVFVGGSERSLSGPGWSPTLIYCTLQRGDVGEVYVEVDGRRSNQRWISAWDMTVKCSRHPFTPKVCSDCEWDMTWRYRLRADVSPVRYEIEKNVTEGGQQTMGRRGATFSFDAVTGHGWTTDATPREFTLSPNAVSPTYAPDSTDGLDEYFSAGAWILPESHKLIVNHVAETWGSIINFVAPPPYSVVQRAGIYGSYWYKNHPFNITIPLDGNLNISSGSQSIDSNGSHYDWQAAAIISKPPSNLPL